VPQSKILKFQVVQNYSTAPHKNSRGASTHLHIKDYVYDKAPLWCIIIFWGLLNKLGEKTKINQPYQPPA